MDEDYKDFVERMGSFDMDVNLISSEKKDEIKHHGILGMRWGVRRYQNKDGTLTPRGQKRYERDISDNLGKKKDKRIDTSKPDPSRWSREDTTRSKGTVDATSNLVKSIQSLDRATTKTPTTNTAKRLDLSKVTDKQMRDLINRELLERQYNNVFNPDPPPIVRKGRQAVTKALETSGATLAVTSSALGIALAIKELRG